MSTEQIPVVNFAAWTHGDPAARAAFVQTLGAGLERFGFVAVEGHGIDMPLLDTAYAEAAALFAMPSATKRRYETPGDGRQRGYTGYMVEHAKDQKVGDLKEFWHVGRTLPADHPLSRSGEVPPNQRPSERPDFAPTFDTLFAQMETFGNGLLDAIGDYLGLQSGFFRALVHEGNSVLRVIHYPPLPDDIPPGAVRAAAHEDINLITVLPVSTQPGLEILTRDGTWLDVAPPPGVMVCDTGDMMALLTGGRLPATTHRVVNPRVDRHLARYSMPFFLHPHPDQLLAPIGGSLPAVRAKDFLHARLVEIGVAPGATSDASSRQRS
jgi:isopenicillin N synthase-like dioxygenase